MSGWVRSSLCAGNGDCIEVKATEHGVGPTVWISRSRTRLGVLAFTRAEWDAFVAGVKAGDFDNLEAAP